jgi:hypothetical protein
MLQAVFGDDPMNWMNWLSLSLRVFSGGTLNPRKRERQHPYQQSGPGNQYNYMYYQSGSYRGQSTQFRARRLPVATVNSANVPNE